MRSTQPGALPIAHATGNLADTIHDGTTEFLFSTLSSNGLKQACHRAFEAQEDEAQLSDMRRATMARYFGCSSAAMQYEAPYRRLMGPRASTARLNPRPSHRVAGVPVAEPLEPAA